MVWIPALVEVGLGTLALGPFLLHRIAVGRWRRTPLEYPAKTTKNDQPSIIVLLPVWNESLIIEKKLSNLASLEGPSVDLLLIDSASTDSTLKHAKVPAT